MFKLGVLVLISHILASAKIIENIQDLDNDLEEIFIEPFSINKHNDKQIWVLSFNDEFAFNILRPANGVERNVFNKIIVPSIQNDIRNAKENDESYLIKSTTKKFTYKKTNETKRLKYENDKYLDINKGKTNLEIKNELNMIINKFFLTSQLIEPTADLLTKKEPSLKLYFIGAYCSLILESGRHKHQYLMGPDTMTLPEWFYDEHKDIKLDTHGAYIEIPEEIKREFYEKIVRLLKSCLGFAI